MAQTLPNNILRKLYLRQGGRRFARLYTQVRPWSVTEYDTACCALNNALSQVPNRLRFPIEGVVDLDRELLGRSFVLFNLWV